MIHTLKKLKNKITYYQNYNDFSLDFFEKYESLLSAKTSNYEKDIFLKRYIFYYEEYLHLFNQTKIEYCIENTHHEIILNIDEFIEWLNDKSIPIGRLREYTYIAFPWCRVEYGIYTIFANSNLIDHLNDTGGYRGYYKEYNFNTHLRATKRIIEELKSIYDYFIERTNDDPTAPIDLTILKKPNKEKPEIKPIKNTPASIQISILKLLGFFELEIFKNKSNTQIENIISKLLNRDTRTIRGNISALNPNSNEDITKYTAGNEGTIAKARDIINSL